MKYKVKTCSIKDLIQLIESNKIDLKPYYQRNDIWTKSDQESLIDTILKGYPLPNFFMYEPEKSKFEMVDGQQRARTIHRFFKGQITNSHKQVFDKIDDNTFLSYELCITDIYDVSDPHEIEEFYVLVNKRGKHLTAPEIHKAEFANSFFLQLVESLLEYQPFINLNLFTESSSKRMTDRSYVEELVAYLIHGIQDKKKVIEEIYKEDITQEHSEKLASIFKRIIDKIEILNKSHQISDSRYKQKNDFYTLFNFIHKNIEQSSELLLNQYKVLLLIDSYISPSNDECPPLREYALNCVSQSNSKKAREARLQFFNHILLNKDSNISKNQILTEIVNYIDQHSFFKVGFNNIDGFVMLTKSI